VKYVIYDDVIVKGEFHDMYAKILQIWRNRKGELYYRGAWYYAPEDTHRGRKKHDGKFEMFYSEHTDDNLTATVLGKVLIVGTEQEKKFWDDEIKKEKWRKEGYFEVRYVTRKYNHLKSSFTDYTPKTPVSGKRRESDVVAARKIEGPTIREEEEEEEEHELGEAKKNVKTESSSGEEEKEKKKKKDKEKEKDKKKRKRKSSMSKDEETEEEKKN